jgi:hypothetical protein
MSVRVPTIEVLISVYVPQGIVTLDNVFMGVL